VEEIWKEITYDNHSYDRGGDSVVILETEVVDFVTRHTSKSYIPSILEQDKIEGRYAMRLTALNETGDTLMHKTIYGSDDRKINFRWLGEDSNDHTSYLDRFEIKAVKRSALKDLGKKLYEEAGLIRRGRFEND